MNNMAAWSIKRPVAVIVIVGLMMILGGVALRGVAVDLLPKLKLPVLVVVTRYPGAGPLEVENLVTRTIEEALGTVGNLEKVSSVSSEGNSLVVAEFRWGTNMDTAALECREKIDLARGFLPDEATEPMVIKMDPALMPVMQLSVSGGRNLSELTYICEEVVKPGLERIDGVSSVELIGGRRREIRVELDPAKLAAYGVGINQVAQAIRTENVSLPAGEVAEAGLELVVRALGEYRSAEDVGRVSLTTASGGRVEVRDLGRVTDGWAEPRELARLNGKPCVGLSIQKKSGANTVAVSALVHKALSSMAEWVPAGIDFATAMDQAEFINRAIGNVLRNLVVGGALAILVLYAFLREVGSTVVIGLSIPVSVVGTFLLVRFYGMTLNMMSLGGLALGVGMLVDNSIVVLENIHRHGQMGLPAEQAALSGTQEVGGAITGSTLTTMAVFLPVLFVSGLASELFSELALTVSFALGCSLLVAVTFVPMVSSRLARVGGSGYGAKARGAAPGEADVQAEEAGVGTRPSRRGNRRLLPGFLGLESLKERYLRLLQWSLSYRKRLLALVAVAVAVSLGLLATAGAEFLPEFQSREIQVNVKMPRGALLEDTNQVISEIEKRIADIPEVENILAFAGSAGGEASFLEGAAGDRGGLLVRLKRGEGRRPAAVEEEVRQLVGDIPGADIDVLSMGAVMGSEEFVGQPIAVKIAGDDLSVLHTLSKAVVSELKAIPGLTDIKSSVEESRPEARVVVNRDKAAAYGLSAAQVAAWLKTSFMGDVVTSLKQEGREVDIKIVLDEKARGSLQALRSLTLLSPLGQPVSLGDVATIEVGPGPVKVEREDQARVVQVTARLDGVNLGTAMKEVRDRLAGLNLPAGYTLNFGGQVQQMTEAFSDLYYALALAVILVYSVLAAQFESFIHPVTIMVSLPLAFVGSAALLGVTRTPLSIPALIGAITLAGIVVNNAIVLLDYTQQLRRRGMDRTAAILQAGAARLRPILMTTTTTVLGLLPLALGLGEGSEINKPLAITVIGGLSVSTLLTLVVVPVVYTIFEDLSERLVRRRRRIAGVFRLKA